SVTQQPIAKGATGGTINQYRFARRQRQTFVYVQIFLKFTQWHCCSIRQVWPLGAWAVAMVGAATMPSSTKAAASGMNRFMSRSPLTGSRLILREIQQAD